MKSKQVIFSFLILLAIGALAIGTSGCGKGKPVTTEGGEGTTVPPTGTEGGDITEGGESLPPGIAVCGNGVKEGSEECDDGNTVSGDGCDVYCVTSRCGNYIVAGTEACDDGNTVDGDGCQSNCTIPGCGNSIKEGTEECDDGNTANGDACDNNCTLPKCGNGAIAPGETCDDRNTVSFDGCSITCQAEKIFTTAFVSKREAGADNVFSSTSSFKSFSKLTNNSGGVGFSVPTYRGDGKKLAFGQTVLFIPTMAIWDQDSGAVSLFNPNENYGSPPADLPGTGPSWHPSGDRIYYLGFKDTGPTEPNRVFEAKADGSNPGEIKFLDSGGGGEKTGTFNKVVRSQVTGSDDPARGKLILSMKEDVSVLPHEIYISDTTSFGNPTSLFKSVVEGLIDDIEPALSHDGKVIAWVRGFTDGTDEIASCEIDYAASACKAGTFHTLARTEGKKNRSPSMCADGSIVFASDRDGNWEIYRMKGDGSDQTRMTNNSVDDRDPTCGPEVAGGLVFLPLGPSKAAF
jgi:cysteine-rich repeat protein